MSEETADRYALIAAGGVIIVLTGAGFWLSYAHLAEVAGRHGLYRSPVRQWVWPATLDMFIVAGELLMLRAGLRRVTDGWAIGLTVAGSVGSIALNVAGVGGTTNGPVPLLDYVVAAVPPTGAMLAFGVLMRQIHQRVARPVQADEVDHAAQSGTGPGSSGTAESQSQPELPAGPDQDPDQTGTLTGPDRTGPSPDPTRTAEPDQHPTPTGPDRPGQRRGRTGPHRPRTVRAKVHAGSRPRTGTRRLSEEEVVALVLPHLPAVLEQDGNRQITRAQLRRIMRAHEIPLGNEHMGPVLTRLRAATASPAPSEGTTR